MKFFKVKIVFQSREATEEEILRVHSQEHVTVLSYNVDQPQDRLNLLSTCYNSIFLNPVSEWADLIGIYTVIL